MSSQWFILLFWLCLLKMFPCCNVQKADYFPPATSTHPLSQLSIVRACLFKALSLLWLVSSYRPEQASLTVFLHQRCWVFFAATAVLLWHHNLAACLKAEFLNTSCVHRSMDVLYNRRRHGSLTLYSMGPWIYMNLLTGCFYALFLNMNQNLSCNSYVSYFIATFLISWIVKSQYTFYQLIFI